jgi:hypothetical protein
MTLAEELTHDLKERGISLETANSVLETLEGVLKPCPKTPDSPGRPASLQAMAMLFLWERLKPNRNRKHASRIIAKALILAGVANAKNWKRLAATVEQTIRNAEI